MEISRLDDKMLAMADSRSPKEISDALGGVISPTRVASRIKELLESRDWLTEAQQDQMVSLKMRDLLAKLEGEFFNLDNAKVQLMALKAIGDRLDKRRAATQVDLNTYHVNVGREMARVYDIAMSYMKGALREDIDPQRWEEAKQEAMIHARSELAKSAVDSEGNAVTSLAA